MAPVNPQQLFPGFNADTNGITIPFAALEGLTAAEADPVNGNGMEVLRIIIDRAQIAFAALAPTARPTRASIEKPPATIAFGNGVPPGTIRQTYTCQFDLTPTGLQPTVE